MKKILSWILAICFLLYLLGIFVIPFLAVNLFPTFVITLFTIGGISGIVLIITLIIERIKDRKEEENDLDKY